MLAFAPGYNSDCYYVTSSLNEQRLRLPLQKSVSTEILVIGAGFTGLHTALRLAEAGRNVIVIDASRIAWAASGRNGGQVITGYGCDMALLERAIGVPRARELWALTRWAAREIRNCARKIIECDYKEGFLYTAVLQRRVKLLQNWVQEAKNKWGYSDLQFLSRTELTQHIASERYQAGVLDWEGGHFHPLKFCLGLADVLEQRGGKLYEMTRALGWRESSEGIDVETEHAVIHCDILVLACNVFIGQLDTKLGRKILPVGTYMATTESLGEELASALIPSGVCVCDNQSILDYFRVTKDYRLLFGGGCHYMGGLPKDIAKAIRPRLERVFPQLTGVRLDHAWGGYVDVTARRTPEFGCRGNIYWALGFSGHGVVPTLVAGRVMADAITGDPYYLNLFRQINNLNIPFGTRLGGVIEALGKCYYRLRDIV